MQLILKNRVIDCDLIDILDKLYVESDGEYLRIRNNKGDNISITCPFHKDGKETHPSCYVYNSNDNDEITFGTYHCFTCGEQGPLYKLVAKVLSISFEDAKYWLIENFSSTFVSEKVYLEPIELSRNIIKPTGLDKSILDDYKYLHPYQFYRGLDESTIKTFSVGWNPNTDSITFPVWDEFGNLVGITERHTKSKRFYIPTGMDKPVYLLNFIKKWNITDVIVCESQINTLTCWSWGFPAIGLIGTGSKAQYEILKRSGIRTYHLAFDGDIAGRHGAIRFKNNMSTDVFIDSIPIPQGKDVNDLSKEQFITCFNNRK